MERPNLHTAEGVLGVLNPDHGSIPPTNDLTLRPLPTDQNDIAGAGAAALYAKSNTEPLSGDNAEWPETYLVQLSFHPPVGNAKKDLTPGGLATNQTTSDAWIHPTLPENTNKESKFGKHKKYSPYLGQESSIAKKEKPIN